jgi:hypothetical protein
MAMMGTQEMSDLSPMDVYLRGLMDSIEVAVQAVYELGLSDAGKPRVLPTASAPTHSPEPPPPPEEGVQFENVVMK